MLTLNEKQQQTLQQALLELPAKTANPILNFLEACRQENEKKEEVPSSNN